MEKDFPKETGVLEFTVSPSEVLRWHSDLVRWSLVWVRRLPVSLRRGFDPLRRLFVLLRWGFVSLRTSYVSLRMDFGSLRRGFVSLRMSFVGQFEISPIVTPCLNLRCTKFPDFEPFLSKLVTVWKLNRVEQPTNITLLLTNIIAPKIYSEPRNFLLVSCKLKVAIRHRKPTRKNPLNNGWEDSYLEWNKIF